MPARIVVTGIGVVSPAGIGPAVLAESLRAGAAHPRAIDGFETADLPCRMGATVPGFDPAAFLGAKETKRLGRASQLLFAAATMALEDSGVLRSPVDRARVGVFEGSALGDLSRALHEHEVLLRKGVRQVNPFTVTAAMPGAGGAMVALRHGLHGLVLNHANGSVSSACAIAAAFDQLQLDHVDVAIVGGSEAPVNRAVLSAFSRVGLLSARNDEPQRASRPFDAARDGLVLAEGAGALVLERREGASARGARAHAEILAVEMTNDAEHLVAPSAEGAQAARAMQLAMQRGRVSPEEIEYVSAHGSATLKNDRVETAAIKLALGARAHGVPCSAVKSMLGHSLGACSILEAIATVLAMQRGFVPPTINLDTPDPECDLDYVPHVARPVSIDLALVHNASFGGRNTSILLRRAP